MIDWTKVNPNLLLGISFGVVVVTAGGTLALWLTGHQDGIPAFLGVMMPILFALFGVKTTQNTLLTQKNNDQNERIIAKVDAVKHEVSK